MIPMLLRTMKENGEEDFVSFIDNNLDAMESHKILRYETLKGIVEQEDMEALHHYVNKGFDLNVRTTDNKTILHDLIDIPVSFLEEMVFLGANIFALDLKGQTPMLMLFKRKKNAPLQDYYLSKGVNPFTEDFKRHNALYYVLEIKDEAERDSRYDQLIQSYPEVKPFNSYVKAGEHEQALLVIIETIKNLGGLDYVLENVEQPAMYEILRKLQGAYMRMNMTAEANQVLQVIINLSEIPVPSMQRIEPFSVIPSLVEQDTETLFKYIDYMIDLNKRYKNKKEVLIVYGYFLAGILDLETHIEKYEKLLKKLKPVSIHIRFLKEVIFAENPMHSSQLIETLEARTVGLEYSMRMEFSLLYGCYFLMKKDYVSAEYIFMKAIDYSHSVPITLMQHAHSIFLLLKYCQSMR